MKKPALGGLLNGLMVAGADLRLMGYGFSPPTSERLRPKNGLRISLRIHHHGWRLPYACEA
jgi:hypothetical protein